MARDFSTLIETPQDLIALRREFHRWPELRFQEHRVAATVEARLRATGLAVRSGIAGTGVFAFHETGTAGPHADIEGWLTTLDPWLHRHWGRLVHEEFDEVTAAKLRAKIDETTTTLGDLETG